MYNAETERLYLKIHSISLLLADTIKEYRNNASSNISQNSHDYLWKAYINLRRSLPELNGKHFRFQDASLALGNRNTTGELFNHKETQSEKGTSNESK